MPAGRPIDCQADRHAASSDARAASEEACRRWRSGDPDEVHGELALGLLKLCRAQGEDVPCARSCDWPKPQDQGADGGQDSLNVKLLKEEAERARSRLRGREVTLRNRGDEQLPSSVESGEDAPSKPVEREELEEKLREALGMCSQFQRRAIETFLEGRTAADLARDLGIPETTIRSQLQRGLDVLRRVLWPRREDLQ